MLVADGQALVRAGFRVLLEGDQGISVVGEAASGEEAVMLAERLRPDVVLIDVNVPGARHASRPPARCSPSGSSP